MEKKPFWKSKTIWGTLVTALGVLLPIVGVEFTAETQADTLKLVGYVMDTVGLVGVVIGRYKAKGAIGVTTVPASAAPVGP